MSRATRKAVLLTTFLGVLCPACGQTPDSPAPQTPAALARTAEADAPNGVCRTGAQMVPHVGCVDEALSFSQDALDACREGAAVECDQRCAQGDTPSCTALGLVKELALESSPNTAYATRLFDKACAAGDGAACNDLGVMHARGVGVPMDAERAEVLYSVACDHSDVVGCANLATARTWGADPPANVASAVLAVENACVSTNNPRACAALGSMRARGSAVVRDEKGAVELFDKACRGGDVAGCELLGQAYLRGNGVDADDVTALQLFRRACDGARSDGCTDLATMYCLGKGVPRDTERSAGLLRQACQAGDEAACRAKSCTGWAPL
jgi:uncharacterized protein